MPAQDRPDQRQLWKNQISRASIQRLAERIGRAYPAFDSSGFVARVVDSRFAGLELKDRIGAIADGLREYLPEEYGRALSVLYDVAPGLDAFHNWALLAYVERHGLEQFELSVAAMERLTEHSTAEFAIRPFMIRYTDQMLPILHRWAQDNNEHVRRLAAEGSRPRGVWVAHIEPFKKDPTPVLELLERLKADSSLYVRKAVANNLNDIAKEHPGRVVALAKAWQKNSHPHTNWILKRGCRTLFKQGRREVFPLFGFSENPKIDVDGPTLKPKRVRIGGELKVAVSVTSRSKRVQKLVIDYAVEYVKARGRTTKVFKWKDASLAAGETLTLERTHACADLSTRTHFPGEHGLVILINGRESGRASFHLVR